jgi:hypothetical protein
MLMPRMCDTRAVKVLKYLQSMAPATVSRSSLDALEELPSSVLASHHSTWNWDEVTEDTQLRNWLAKNPVPSPKAKASSALFHGTLVFVQLVFEQPSDLLSSMSLTDVGTARNYAALAVVPIQRYASQYGPNSVSVAPDVISFTAKLKGPSFSIGQFEGWVEKCAQLSRANDVANPCIVILHNRNLLNSPSFRKHRDSFHSSTGNGTPYCYSLVFGEDLSVADNNHTNNGRPHDKVYAHNLSHEIAEMVVDPFSDSGNPEVCDACSGNCNVQFFDLFDQNGVFMGGTADTAAATGFAFFINSIVSPDAVLNGNQCVVQGDARSACIYPPPIQWGGQNTLTTINGPVSVAGHFSIGDGRHLVVAGTQGGRIHEIFWRPGQVGIEGEDDLPDVAFQSNTIASVGTMYNVDQNRHLVFVGTTFGTVHEIFWRPDTVGIEGQDDLPVNFPENSIVGVTGLYDSAQQRHIVIVGTTAGTVHEIFWKADTVGIEGDDDLPVAFAPRSIVGVTAMYNSDDQRYVVVVGTTAGKLHEIFWQATTAGIEGHDDLPIDFGTQSIVALSGFYDSNRTRYVVAVATADGNVHQVYWHPLSVGIEAHSVVANFSPHGIVSVAAFYSAPDHVNHLVVALSNGEIRELWVVPDL